MKNLKLLSLLGIAMFSLLSFTYFKEVYQIKDGTYNSTLSMKYLVKAGSNPQKFIHGNDKLAIKIENEKIKEIITYSKIANNNKLIGLALHIDDNGNAIVETSDIVHNIANKKDEGTFIEYKLIIKKEDLIK
jgi:hypothetical protein